MAQDSPLPDGRVAPLCPSLTRGLAGRVVFLKPSIAMKFSLKLAVGSSVVGAVLCGTCGPALARGNAEHVVVLVWDGMRPDFITPQNCPNLYSLATNGVFFKNNHCAYVSSTEVNGTALATGVHPGRSRVIANTEYRPEISVTGTFATEGLDAIRRGDLLTGGHYLGAETLAEILQDEGIPTIIAGSKPVALLHDRSNKKNSASEKESVLLFEGKTIPRIVGDALPKANDDKNWPSNAVPNTAQDNWTTRSLLRVLWKKNLPRYTLLWLSDPDKSQHEVGVGAPNALAGIDSSDKNLGEVIKALKERGVYEKTDIMVVSDHGFSTIAKGPDVVEILKKAKFSAFKKNDNPEAGDVMVVGLGGSVMFYVVEHQESVIRRLVEFLQQSDFAGVIFSKLSLEGTFPLDAVRYSGTNAGPDVMISMRWTHDKNEHGAPGMFCSMDGTKGKGSHASLSRYDMNNTLVASGPDFRRGMISNIPSGNIDVAPTVLFLLGVKSPAPMDGRVLHEALISTSGAPPTVRERTLEASRDLGLFRWSQYLKFFEVDNATYFHEGNGAAQLK
jgi:arylsulfatase A-like enzyme